jgi:hypothetical protein
MIKDAAPAWMDAFFASKQNPASQSTIKQSSLVLPFLFSPSIPDSSQAPTPFDAGMPPQFIHPGREINQDQSPQGNVSYPCPRSRVYLWRRPMAAAASPPSSSPPPAKAFKQMKWPRRNSKVGAEMHAFFSFFLCPAQEPPRIKCLMATVNGGS